MEPLEALLGRLAARTPAPGGGAAAAWACALAAALGEMAAGYADDAGALARARALRDRVLGLAQRDGEAYAAYLAARRARDPAAPQALAAAAEPPLAIAEAAAEAAELAAELAVGGRPSVAGDAVTAAVLAEAAAAAAGRLAELDLAPASGGPRAERARAAAARAAAARERALRALR
jgi:formiminotetrahydrofolate cyclodeaminase